MNKYILLVCFVLLNQVFWAQEKWTLQDCMLFGQENSYQLMIANLEQQVVEAQKQSTASYYLPNIGLNASQSYNYGSAIDPTTNTRVSSNIQSLQTSVDANISLFDWSNFIDHRLKQLNISYASLEAEEVKFYYQQQILDLFFKIIGIQEFLKLQKNQLENSRINYERVTKEVDAGAKPQSDLYDIEYIFNNEQIRLQETANELSNQKLQLLHLLDVKEKSIADYELVFEKDNWTTIVDYEFNPTVEKTRLYQQLLATEKQSLKSKNYPVLIGNYQFGSFYTKPFNTSLDWQVASFAKQLGDNKSHYIGLGLNIPVFRSGSVARQLQQNKAKKKLNEAQIANKERALDKENELLLQEINQAETMNQTLENSILLAKKTFGTTQIKYENGKADIFSFNAAKNSLLNAEFALIQNEIKRVFLNKKRILNYANHF